MKLLSIREKLVYSYFHVVKNGSLPADPDNQNSKKWTTDMQKQQQFGFQ